MIVEAIVKYKDGNVETIHASGFVELFATIGKRDIESIDAYEIGVEDIRQGRRAEYVL